MLELLKSLVFAVIMVPVVMAVILGLIYGLGEVFNLFSGVGHKDRSQQNHCFPGARFNRALCYFPPVSFPFVLLSCITIKTLRISLYYRLHNALTGE